MNGEPPSVRPERRRIDLQRPDFAVDRRLLDAKRLVFFWKPPDFDLREPRFDLEMSSFEDKILPFAVSQPPFGWKIGRFDLERRPLRLETPRLEVHSPLFQIENVHDVQQKGTR